MRLPLSLFIALRYLKGLRRGQAAPLLAGISIAALGIGSAALVVLLSVFNGFEGLISELYKSFYPDLRIRPAEGKFFQPDAPLFELIKSQPGVIAMARVAEDHVWATNTNADQQVLATLKGVDDSWFDVDHLEPYLLDESYPGFSTANAPELILGVQLAAQLGAIPGNAFSRVALHYPNPDARLTLMNAANAFQTEVLAPTGVFEVQQEFDGRYMLAPLAVAQRLFAQEGKISALEVKVENNSVAERLKKSLQKKLGNRFVVETRYEQNKSLYAVMRSEKWAIYLILVFVLLLASVNMIGALSLLALEKERDASILKAMGAVPATIRKAFLLEGALWGFCGGGAGVLLGLLICVGQQHFSWVRLEGFIIDSYPVAVKVWDMALVWLTAVVVGTFAAAYPAFRLARKKLAGAWNTR